MVLSVRIGNKQANQLTDGFIQRCAGSYSGTNLWDEIGVSCYHLNIFGGDFIVLHDHSQSGDDGPYSFGRLQEETVCRDDVFVRQMRVLVRIQCCMQVGDENSLPFLAHKNHHLFGQGALREQVLHGIEHIHRQIFFRSLWERLEADVSAFFLVRLVELLDFIGRIALAVYSFDELLFVRFGLVGLDNMLEER